MYTEPRWLINALMVLLNCHRRHEMIIGTKNFLDGENMQSSLKTVVSCDINTFEELTHKFEGQGFAISIKAALDEFDAL